jgi:hypothetical protein
MEDMSETHNPAGDTMTIYSMWAVSYCLVNGVQVAATVRGSYGRMGWRLDNHDGRAKVLLDEWRSGVAIVNGRALLDMHNRLMSDVKNLT